jgi:hypothetical protein
MSEGRCLPKNCRDTKANKLCESCGGGIISAVKWTAMKCSAARGSEYAIVTQLSG